MSPYRRLIAIASSAALLLAGCDSEFDQVRAYSVPKETRAADMPRLAAMDAPVNPAVAAAAPIRWQTPAGWRDSANPNPMRFATLQAGAGESAVEVAITQLSGPAGGIPANVNRWRGQLGLPELPAAELLETLEQVHAGGVEGVIVDLTGAPVEGGAAARILAAIFNAPSQTWFIKATGSSAALDQQRDAFVQLCQSVRFDAPAPASTGAAPAGRLDSAERTSPPTAQTPDNELPEFPDPPAGWTRDATPRPMASASFTVTGYGQEASLTVTPLGGSQDLLANINRWRRQVGLGALGNLSEEPPEKISVDGRPAWLVNLRGPQAHTLAVTLTQDTTTWFFKLSGPDPLIEQQAGTFVEFVQGVRLRAEVASEAPGAAAGTGGGSE